MKLEVYTNPVAEKVDDKSAELITAQAAGQLAVVSDGNE